MGKPLTKHLKGASITFNAWNTEIGKSHKLFNVIGNVLKGKGVGHASAVIEMPVNQYTTDLVSRYCLKLDDRHFT